MILVAKNCLRTESAPLSNSNLCEKSETNICKYFTSKWCGNIKTLDTFQADVS